MQLEDFIKPYVEKLKVFKKKTFTEKTCHDFLLKLCKQGDLDKIESELNKCLMNSCTNRENMERRKFMEDFIKDYKKYSSENVIIKSSEGTEEQIMIDIDNPLKKISRDNNELNLKKFKIKNKDVEFPTIENLELENRKKKFEVLDHHYVHKLEKGNKICFCMSSKHPLVGNCTSCGRIQCLQEGDKECIVCGSSLIKKEDYLKLCTEDWEMKKSFNHKEKLLKFQADFYSKLQIIDDFSDWYEISNNTWISKEHREFAKKKDEENDRIRDDPEFEYNVNFKTLEITKVYEKIDEVKMRDDISNFFIDSIRKAKENQEKTKEVQMSTLSCRGITEKAIKDLNSMANNRDLLQMANYEQNMKKLSKRIDLDINEKIGEQFSGVSSNHLQTLRNIPEAAYYIEETDVGMCLSMHQPWASLLIEGFKRFEGREWDSDYRGILWIHATSKKPEPDLIKMIEDECLELYKHCKNLPKFPKRYQTSVLLGCVDVVDVLKKDSYMKVIHKEFRERTDSKFLFMCKNPRRLEIPIKMPGQQNLYKLSEETLERTKGKLVKVNTSWWPCSGYNVDLFDIPFSYILKSEINNHASTSYGQNYNKKGKNPINNKLRIKSLYDDFAVNSLIIIQSFVTRDKKESIVSLIDSYKKEMTYYNDYKAEPFIRYGLCKDFSQQDTPKLFLEFFKEIQSILKNEQKMKIDLNLKNVKIEYIDLYGCQNFREVKNKSIILILGNPINLAALGNINDSQGKFIKIECGDMIFIEEKMLYSINQVFYDTINKGVKLKQGSCIISFICE